MATQEEARQAVIDSIVRVAPRILENGSSVGETVKGLAEAWAIVAKPAHTPEKWEENS